MKTKLSLFITFTNNFLIKKTKYFFCIAGVGGNLKKLVRTTLSGRKIIAIDGCPLACSKACLSNHSLQPDIHIELTSLGVPKKQHEDFDKKQANEILEMLQETVQHTSTSVCFNTIQ